MKQGRQLIVLLLCAFTLQAQGAFKQDEEAFAKRQNVLDHQCEAARNEKLQPIREASFRECMTKTRGSNAEKDCRRKTGGENGNRIGGSPRFYDLPACVEAFEHRRKRP
jgi:hypothetical protein